jgi:hypothetical protein
MAENYKPRPENRREFMNKLVMPYDPTTGNPNSIVSEPVNPGQPEFNRANEISLNEDTDKNVSVGIKDIDEAIVYYFNEVLKLSVVQNNTRLQVPVLYGSPERWKAIQADGYYRDGNGKVQSPLIVFRKSSITPVRDIGNKLDGNKVSNIILAEKKFNRRNVYDNFNILTNRVQSKEYVVAFPPDYVKVTYNCIIYTDFVEQMDKLVEAINFASNSYWGDPSKYQFKNMIDSYSNQIVMEQGADRTVKTTFDMVMNGYIIPDSLNREVASANRAFSTSQVIFGLEIADSQEQFNANIRKPKAQQISAVMAADSTNVLIQNIDQTTTLPQQIIDYLNTNKQLIGTFVDSNTITFASGWLSAPSGLPATSISNFSIFCNGIALPNNAIQSFSDGGSTTTLVIDPAILEYSFTSQDVVTAVGKFSI